MLTLTGSKQLAPSCIVGIDNSKKRFNDFVTVGYDPVSGQTTMMHNTDIITMGMAARMLLNKFQEMYVDLTEEARLEVDKFFHGADAVNEIHNRGN